VDGGLHTIASGSFIVNTGVSYHIRVKTEGAGILVYDNDFSIPDLVCMDTQFDHGAIGYASFDADASFDNLKAIQSVRSQADAWHDYPNLDGQARWINPIEWSGDVFDMHNNTARDGWGMFWFEHLPKKQGTHVQTFGDGTEYKVLNSWWPYIFDFNTFDGSSIENEPEVPISTDTLAPNPVTSLRHIGTGTHSITISWDEPADNIGVTRYEIRRNGRFLQMVNRSRFTDVNVYRGVTYTYEVTARDGSCNTSEPRTITATFP
jgi:hypothetical protein